MTPKEFAKKYGLHPGVACEHDIVSVIPLGYMIPHGDSASSNEFAVVVFPLLGQHFPDHATHDKALSVGLKPHGLTEDGAFVYLFDARNATQARMAIELIGLDRHGSSNRGVPGIGKCR